MRKIQKIWKPASSPLSEAVEPGICNKALIDDSQIEENKSNQKKSKKCKTCKSYPHLGIVTIVNSYYFRYVLFNILVHLSSECVWQWSLSLRWEGILEAAPNSLGRRTLHVAWTPSFQKHYHFVTSLRMRKITWDYCKRMPRMPSSLLFAWVVTSWLGPVLPEILAFSMTQQLSSNGILHLDLHTLHISTPLSEFLSVPHASGRPAICSGLSVQTPLTFDWSGFFCFTWLSQCFHDLQDLVWELRLERSWTSECFFHHIRPTLFGSHLNPEETKTLWPLRPKGLDCILCCWCWSPQNSLQRQKSNSAIPTSQPHKSPTVTSQWCFHRGFGTAWSFQSFAVGHHFCWPLQSEKKNR